MKNALKLGLLVIGISIFASGCFGCGDGSRNVERSPKDSDSVAKQKPVDTAKKNVIDTTKKDTTHK